MSNNQKISFPRELSDELAELIAEKARVCGGGAFDIWEAICEQFGTQAQHQGEPVDDCETFEYQLEMLGAIDRCDVACGSYGDKFHRWDDTGPYVEYEDHVKHIELYKLEVERLSKLYAKQSAPDNALKDFANDMITAAFEGGSFDGGDIQDIAVKHGLLRIEQREEECGEVCACRSEGDGFPAECYRKTALLRGEQPAPVATAPIQEDPETLIGYGRSSGLKEASTLCTRLAYAAYYPPGTRFKAFTPKAQKALGDLLIKAANEIASLPGGPYERFKARQAKKAASAESQ